MFTWLLRRAWIALIASTACSPGAWVKGEAEPTLVDRRRAGIEVIAALVRVADPLIRSQPAAPSASGPKVVAFIGIDNFSAEELSENQESLYEKLDTILSRQSSYTLLSRHYVESVLRSRGMRASDLLLPAGRDEFAAVVGAEGLVPEVLIHGTLTSASSEGIAESEREYQLTLEWIDAYTGRQVAKESTRVRKGYRK